MKNVKIGLILVLSFITVSLCGILVLEITGANIIENSDRRYFTEAQLVLEEEIVLDGIDSISVLYGMNSNDIYFFESENETVIIREYSSSELKETELSAIKVEENNLEIKGARRSHNSGSFHFMFYYNSFVDRHYTEVYLPKSYHGEILLKTASGDIVSDLELILDKDFSASSTSGDVNFSSLTADNVMINTSSGFVKIGNINTNLNGFAGEIGVKTTSGDVEIKELAGETTIESSSGYLTIGTIEGDTQLKTTSGDMDITGIKGETITETSSGNVTIGTMTGDAQLKTASGDVNIRHADGNIRAMTTSGDVKILAGSGDRVASTSSGSVITEGTEGSFRVNTQSGDVRIMLWKGEGNIETTSGDIQLSLDELAGTLHITSSSGNVNIGLSYQNEFDFSADTGSGGIMTFFDEALNFSSRKDRAQGTYGTNTQGNRIEIQTSSGDVKISKK